MLAEVGVEQQKLIEFFFKLMLSIESYQQCRVAITLWRVLGDVTMMLFEEGLSRIPPS